MGYICHDHDAHRCPCDWKGHENSMIVNENDATLTEGKSVYHSQPSQLATSQEPTLKITYVRREGGADCPGHQFSLGSQGANFLTGGN